MLLFVVLNPINYCVQLHIYMSLRKRIQTQEILEFVAFIHVVPVTVCKKMG